MGARGALVVAAAVVAVVVVMGVAVAVYAMTLPEDTDEVSAFWAVKLSDLALLGTNTNENEAVSFLRQYDVEASVMCNRFMEASWDFNTNVTDFNRRKMLAQQMEWAKFHREKWTEATSFAWKNFTNPDVRRMFSFLTVLGKVALPKEKMQELTELLQSMKTIYSTAKICRYDSRLRRLPSGDYDYFSDFDAMDSDNEIPCIPSLSLEPHLTNIMSTSRDPSELRYVWRAWREVAGKPLRQQYLRFVDLANEAAKLNGFNDAGEYWRSEYEVDNFEEQLEVLWEKLRPLYQQLHAYVRAKLVDNYGETVVPRNGPIPAHLLGNMWAQTWTNVMNLTIPFRGRTTVDVTNALRSQGYTPLAMFRLAEEFFTSLGLEPMPISFWQNSLFQKPTDREVVCHASAWDFCNGFDYRIKQCTEVTTEYLFTTHHEMGHIQYDLQYRNQPFVFRDGANPGFHEAVGDVMALSASTPRHLQAVGLLDNVDESFETDINFLYAMALDKIAFLPFGYLMDKWRWEVFRGDTTSSNLNTRWWDMRLSIQGVSPPVPRSEEDFDPGAKFHVPANVPYVRYFVSFIIQFQFHSELCKAAGHQGPLHRCDIYRSQRAGKLLRDVLSLGKSRPWTEALQRLTGGKSNTLDVEPILEYFAPLQSWLESQNRGQLIGWRESEAIVQPITTSSLSMITGVILACIAVLLLLALIFIVVRRVVRSGKAKTPTQGT
ncbi:angiotensin-converting enzyme-like isoform X1 [Portunus trituberculatus]|uniref:angiotensin-converting enzyme-like isoform X1 n=1 Tax=Portunus trituberculatus TaxID=210409 RepID=UPI001E1CF6D3|nr:angiotensin-converting enzyme-like isoform X1 [Portunus trituberculatus]